MKRQAFARAAAPGVAAFLTAAFLSAGWLPIAQAQEAAAAAEKVRPHTSLKLGGPSGAADKIGTALKQKTDLEFVDAPLLEALRYITDKHKIDIQYDVIALRDAAIDPTAIPVRLNVHGISLRSALNLMLSQFNLQYIVADEVLQITTRDKANTHLQTVIYDVHDLINQSENRRPDFQSLINLLTNTIASPTWSTQGGPGSIDGFGPGSLVVSQTGEVQDEIAALISRMRGVIEELQLEKPNEMVWYGKDDLEDRFEKLLEQKVDLSATELPLVEALNKFRQPNKLDIQYDVVALRDAAIDPRAIPVSATLKDVPLSVALKVLLSQNNLTHILQDEVLLVTTKDKANTQLITRLYPVGDLAAKSNGKAPHSDDDASAAVVRELVSIIANTIALPTWAQVGGPGTIESLDKAGGILAVSQTQEVHDEITELLSKLRIMQKQQLETAAHEPAEPQKPETLELRVYDLRASAPNSPAMTPQEVMEVVKGLVEPKSWTQPDVYIRGATGKLIVKQLPSVHRQVEKLLDELGAQVPKMPGASGGRRGANGPGGGGF